MRTVIKSTAPLVYVGLAILLQACSQQEIPGTPSRGIVQIAEDLYRVQDDFHFTVFLVTPEGIILGDPINADAAMWLKGELAERFDVPVRYVLYSHYHWDHASGAQVFDDTATIIGHANMPIALADAIATFPVQVTLVDANGDQKFDREEVSGELAQDFDEIDTNGDGFLDGGEILVDVMLPEVLYTERMTITLGGKTVELIHPGPSHSTDTTVLLFPEQRTIYGVDFLNVQRLAFGFPGDGTLQQWIDSLRAVEALDFDIVSPGHSTVGTKEDLAAYRQYFEDLQAVVTDAVDSGTTLADLLSSDVLTDYSDLPNYDPQRDRNIEEAYNLLTQ